MSTSTAAPRVRRHGAKSSSSPASGKSLRIPYDQYRKLSETKRKAFDNWNADNSRMAYVNGAIEEADPFDVVLDPIHAAISKTIPHDCMAPSPAPIHEETMIDGVAQAFVRRRTDHESATAELGLCLPHVYFDCRVNAFENCAAALEGVAKLLTDAAARVRKLDAATGD